MPLPPAETKHDHLPRTGDTVDGKYVVENVVGAGGMGLVVAARHLGLGTRVALKFLGGVAITDELRGRFRREAQAAASIRNEHVARVLDTGMLADQTPYMVMDLLEGRDLGVELRLRRRLPLEEVADYLVQACDGLAEAHARGIVHRDVKPSNLFLCRRPSGHVVLKVLDFGISKAEGANEGDQTLTNTSTILGSPSYMSPEQIRHAKGVDARTDVWSLGVVLHQLLTGKLPFRGDGTSSTLASVMVDDAPSVRALNPELPEAIDDIVRRCLQKRPGFRFQSVRELAAALAPHASERARALVAKMPSTIGEIEPTLVDAKPSSDGSIGLGVTHESNPARTLSPTEPASDTQAASVIDEPSRPPRSRARTALVAGLVVVAASTGLWVTRDAWRSPPSTALGAAVGSIATSSAVVGESATGTGTATGTATETETATATVSATAAVVAPVATSIGKTPKWGKPALKPYVKPSAAIATTKVAEPAATPTSTLKSVLDGHK